MGWLSFTGFRSLGSDMSQLSLMGSGVSRWFSLTGFRSLGSDLSQLSLMGSGVRRCLSLTGFRSLGSDVSQLSFTGFRGQSVVFTHWFSFAGFGREPAFVHWVQGSDGAFHSLVFVRWVQT